MINYIYISPPFLSTIIKDTFKDSNTLNEKYLSLIYTQSNIGILKCLDLIFSFKYNLYNIGFWMFLILVTCHIPLYIHYFIKGIISILVYCENFVRNRNDINIKYNSLTNKANNLLDNKKNKNKNKRKRNDKKNLKDSSSKNKSSRSNINLKFHEKLMI